MKHYLYCFLLSLIVSCSAKKSKNIQQADQNNNSRHKIDTIAVYVDSMNIGISKSNKIFLASVLIDDSIPKSLVRFYHKENNYWNLKYSFEDEHWTGSVLSPEVSDFNNDDYKDLRYLKGTGARGGNSINNLFIYDKSGDSLAYVQNSNDYPNLRYNKETNSLMAYILTGSIETYFLRLDSNRLIPFASIFQFDKQIKVSAYDQRGESKVIHVDSSGKFGNFTRFSNYKPLKVEE